VGPGSGGRERPGARAGPGPSRITFRTTQPPDPIMAPETTLHVALQDGFDDDAVVVRIDGREVYREDDVVTDTRISLADSFEVEASGAPALLEVELPARHVRDSFQLPPPAGGEIYVGVSFLEGSLQFRASARPFGYV